MENMPHTDLFMTSPEAVDRYVRAKTVISILGGDAFEDGARTVGQAVARAGFSVRTGGYDTGAMRGGLVGAAAAVAKDLDVDVRPMIEGVVTAQEPYPTTEVTDDPNVKISVAADPYERLKILVRDADMLVIGEGSVGTLTETLSAFGIEVGREITHTGTSQKPIVFVGSRIKERVMTLDEKISTYLTCAPNIIFVDTAEDVAGAIETTFHTIAEQKRNALGI
jgi:predicted Rossmann-fold nucleotide-binding protein